MTTKITTYYSPKAFGSSCFLFPRIGATYFNKKKETVEAYEILSKLIKELISATTLKACEDVIKEMEKHLKAMEEETLDPYDGTLRAILARGEKAHEDVIKERKEYLKAMDEETLDPYDGTLRQLYKSVILENEIIAYKNIIKKMIKHLKAMEEEASKEILVGKAAISATLKAHEDDIIKLIKHFGTTCKDFFEFPPVIDVPEDMIEVTVELSGCPEENSIENEL